MAKFHFENERVAKKWTLKNLGRKWKDFKCKLWPEFYDPAASRDELISNCPPGIHRDQWSSFVNYRLSEKSMERILREMGQSSSSQAQFVSQDDALGKIIGKEHPGRVRALGFCPCPSTAFESTYNATQRPSNDSQMKAYVASLEKELATTKSQLEDMKKTFGGALVTVFQNAFGKVPDQFATWLNQTSEVAPMRSGHQPPSGNGIQYSSSTMI
ncbi:hypothetical protein DH2020_016041 [Rehmannia glutinosa]|uniref:Uncharacterized protein n=1 Tax=Rehmannia glutinosa TaxID=99300 RepID=A0ABR0WXW3_REHGL